MGDQQFLGMPSPWSFTVTRIDDGCMVAVRAGPMLPSSTSVRYLEMRDLVIRSLTQAAASRARLSPPLRLQPSQCRGSGPATRARRPGLVHHMGLLVSSSASARLRLARLQAGQGLNPCRVAQAGRVRVRITELIKQHGTLPAPGSLFHDIARTPGLRHGANRPAACHSEELCPRTHAGHHRRRPRWLPAMAPHPHTPHRPAGMPAPDRKPVEAPMAATAREAAQAMLTTSGTPRVSGRTCGWPRGDRDRNCRLPLCRGECWCTPSTDQSRPGLADRRDRRVSRRARRAGGRPGHPALHPVRSVHLRCARPWSRTQHLTAADAGALAGLMSLPSLRTWLDAWASSPTHPPAALQCRLASQMLAIEPADPGAPADHHIAQYTGHQAVALGRNPRRGKPTRNTTTRYTATWPDGRSLHHR